MRYRRPLCHKISLPSLHAPLCPLCLSERVRKSASQVVSQSVFIRTESVTGSTQNVNVHRAETDLSYIVAGCLLADLEQWVMTGLFDWAIDC